MIAALHKGNEKKSSQIRDLELEIKSLQDAIEVGKQEIKEEYTVKMNAFAATLSEKEAAYKIMQQEFIVIKDFRVG